MLQFLLIKYFTLSVCELFTWIWQQGDPLSPILFNLLLQKEIQSIKMVPSGMKIGKGQLNI